MKIGSLIQCKASVWEKNFRRPAPEGAFLIIGTYIEEVIQYDWWERSIKDEDRLHFYTLVQPDGTMTKWNSNHTIEYYEVIS